MKLAVIIISISILIFLLLWGGIVSLRNELTELRLKHSEDLAAARKDAAKRSKSIVRGQAIEHLAPFLIDGANPKDMRFLGQPIDYLWVKGLSDALTDDSADAKEETFVYILDIKTGNSSLNKAQQIIKEAIVKGNIAFAIYNPDTKKFKEYRKIDNDKPKGISIQKI